MTNVLKQYEYYQFVLWLAMPTPLRKENKLPDTQAEFASFIGVDESTLSRWKHDSNFEEDRRRALMGWLRDKTANVMAGLYSKCIKGDPMAAKLWLQYVEGWSEKIEHKETREVILREVSEDEMALIKNAFRNFGLLKSNDTNEPNTNREPSGINGQGPNTVYLE